MLLSPEEQARLGGVRLDDLVRGSVTLSRPNAHTIILQGPSHDELLRASSVIRALSLGFPRDVAASLWDEEISLVMVPLRAELPPRDTRCRRGSASHRLLAHDSLNLRVIQNFTGVSYRIVDERELWLLGPVDSVSEASREARQIARGRTRGTVQQYHRGKHEKIVKRRGHL